MRILSIALLFGALLLSGCAVARFDSNEPLDVLAFQSLVPGETTAAQAVEVLGAPMEVVQLANRSAYRWDAGSAKTAVLILLIFNMANQDERTDRIWLFFDQNEMLTHKSGTFQTHRNQYAAVWEDIHEESDNAARDAYRPGLGGGAGK